MRYFCTYCDKNYLPRALALYESLARTCPSFTLWVLCFDDDTLAAIRQWNWPGLKAIALADFEAGDAPLATAKAGRTLVEYFFTCTATLVLYLLDRHPEIDVLSYVDADLYFFAEPSPIFAELDGASVLIIGHRFPEDMRSHERYGIYNVGLVAFCNDARARVVLTWWRERCLDLCSDSLEGGQFGDQKYLDDWPERFEGVAVLRHKGGNVAPWNLRTFPLELRGGQITVGGDPLVFYHFHNLRVIRPRLFDPCFRLYSVTPSAVTRRIYGPYLVQLYRYTRLVGQLGNPRLGRTTDGLRALLLHLVYVHSIVVIGGWAVPVYLEPLVRPFLALKHALAPKA